PADFESAVSTISTTPAYLIFFAAKPKFKLFYSFHHNQKLIIKNKALFPVNKYLTDNHGACQL
ncbi:MAG: hypothetical protein ACQEQS_09835, partial [Thermodesulfobacteriota bacterium]